MIASSFAGPNDKRLPPAVRRMAKPLRELWVATFNAGAGNESAAYKLAWKTVRAAITCNPIFLQLLVVKCANH